MNNLIVLPARGGSKGIPLINIFPLNGKPLLEYTIETILEAQIEFTDIVVSKDSEKINEVASKYEGIFVVDRPDYLASDTASTEDALLHALDYMEQKLGKKYEAILTLQPTSPLRKKETLIDFIREYENNKNNYDALLALTEDRTDMWILDDDNRFCRLNPNAPRRRQDRKPMYKENSAYYITDVEILRKTHSVLGSNVGGYVISDREGIDINEPIDLKIAEAFLNDSNVCMNSVGSLEN